MSGWLSKAVEAFAKKPPPPPETFDVGCDCGGRVTGIRVSAAQKPSCPVCGQQVFVLPANVYPVAEKTTPKKAGATGKNTKPGSSTAANDTNPKSTSRKGNSSGTSRSNVADSADKKTVGDVDQLTSAPPPDAIALDTRVRIFTPFRLIAAAMIVVCSVTAWGLFGRYQVESAKAIVAKATELGLKSIKEQDYSTAVLQLEKASRAIDLLKRHDDEAKLVKRMLREAVAAKGLADATLVELARESLADVKKIDSKPGEESPARRWESQRFEGLYRNSWVIFDAIVIASQSPNDPCVVELPVFHHGNRIRIQVVSKAIWTLAREAAQSPLAIDAVNHAEVPPTTGADAVAEVDQKTDATANQIPRLIFAAQLEQIIPAGATFPEAVLVLNGKSAFGWTSFETYTALGGGSSDEDDQKVIRAILSRQLRAQEDEVAK